MQANPDPGLLATLLPLLGPLSHLRWHPLWHPCQLQTGPCTPRWVTLPFYLASSSLSSENYPGLCSFGKVSKDGVPKAKVSKALKSEKLIHIPGWQHQLWDAAGWRRLEREVTHLLLKFLICLRVDPEKAGMPPNRRVTTVVKGKNIGLSFLLVHCLKVLGKMRFCILDICTGYGATCECMVQSAIVILQETAKWSLSLKFGHIANTISTIYSFLAQIAKCRRGVQSGLCLCRDYPCLQVIKQEHKVSSRCSLPLPLQKRSKVYKKLHRSSASFFWLWKEVSQKSETSCLQSNKIQKLKTFRSSHSLHLSCNGDGNEYLQDTLCSCWNEIRFHKS